MDLYNKLLDAWACAALFRTVPHPVTASQRAREILVTLQQNYDDQQRVAGPSDDDQIQALQPNAESFRIVLYCVAKVEGALMARRFLAWMEYLHKSGNSTVLPTRSHYIQVLDAYARMRNNNNAGVLAEAFLRHMQVLGVQPVDTLCYNIAIKAWTKAAGRNNRRTAAEHADRILEEMKASENCQPDVVTYACK